MPRNRKIWLFGSTFGRRYADNPRYLYLYINQHMSDEKSLCKEIRPVWITGNQEIYDLLSSQGYEVYTRGTLKAILMCLRGGVYIYDNYPKDISHWLSGGAVKINLWHGLPLKKIQNDNVFDEIRHPKTLYGKWKAFPRRLSDEKPLHYVLATSEFIKPVFSSAFKTDRVIVNGYPRNDIFTSNEIRNVLLNDEIESLMEIEKKRNEYTKVFYYMPTFRKTEEKFFEIINVEKFEKFLDESNYLLCLKLHCKSKLKEVFEKISSDNIVVINPNADPYVFMDKADVMISDYSSVYFDYLLTDNPIIFFDYDLEEYLSESREMYFDYREFTPGKKVQNQKDLQIAMEHAANDSSEYSAERHRIRKLAFKDEDGTASENIINQVYSITDGE